MKTFRQLLEENSVDNILAALAEIEEDGKTDGYVEVIEELLALPVNNDEKIHPFIVTMCGPDEINDEAFVDVSIKNLDYEGERPEGLRPWGGKPDDKHDAPEGYYNINYDNYHQCFGILFQDRKELIDAPVIDEVGLSDVELVAQILWEITFYGFTEDQLKETQDEIVGSAEEAKEWLENEKQ